MKMRMPICQPASNAVRPTCRIICHAAAPQSPREKQEAGVQFTYRSEDGRAKATMEDVFTPAQAPTDEINPWQFSWQMNERVLVWSDDLKERLVKVCHGT